MYGMKVRNFAVALLVMSAVAGLSSADPVPRARGRVAAQESAAVERAANLNTDVERLYGEGRYREAVTLAEEALRISGQTLGPIHPAVATSLSNLAVAFDSIGQYDRAVPLIERALAIRAAMLQRISTQQREEGFVQFLRTMRGDVSASVSFAGERPQDASARRTALLYTLVTKARGEEEATATLAAARRDRSAEGQRALREWSIAQQRLSALTPQAPAPTRQQAEEAVRIAEEALARRSDAVRQQRGLADVGTLLPRLTERLPRDGVLVEVVRFEPFNARARTEQERWGASRYAAFVLHPDGRHALADLGDAVAVETAARELSDAVSDRQSTQASVVRAAQALHTRLFAPLVTLIGAGTRRIVFAPDGPLHTAPLHLMHDGRDWLMDRYTVSYVTSGRDLLRERSPQDVPTAPVAIAATQYAVPAWNLAGVAWQADRFPQLLPGVRVVRNGAATESALLGVDSPFVLHVAAHGQFLDDTSAGASRSAMSRGRLLLADADPALAGRFDRSEGYATAQELLTTNLRGTRLVVLSACDTARGTTAAGDGVLGLRRAFLLAGAEALVTTQWSVDERAGTVFTVALYEGLRAGMRSADAVANAMRVVRARDPHPFAWAPFVLVGRDDVMDWNAVTARGS